MSALAPISTSGPIPNPADAGISEMSESALAYEIARFEQPFRRDLMLMAKTLGEPAFRRYTALCRAMRAAKRSN